MWFELWLAFTVASAVLLAIPGPTVMLVISHALGRGQGSGWATVPGVILGDATAMTISLMGAGAVLAASATLFTVLKLVGAAYLIWLGVQLWRASPSVEMPGAAIQPASRRDMFVSTYIVTALNPKSIVFFVAFVPQFVVSDAPPLPQFAILEATFLALAGANAALWAVLAGRMRTRFRRPAALRLINRLGGGVLIGAGLLTAAARRGA